MEIEALVNNGDLQLGLFDQRNLFEITSQRFPGERLVASKNPALAQDRARKREELLLATERELDKVVEASQAGRLKVRMPKHFQLDIADKHLSYQRDVNRIAAEAGLDGLYAIRSSVVGTAKLADTELVRGYKLLAGAERSYRTMKSVDLQVRPVHHLQDDRVRAQIFICSLAYLVRRHLERAWAPLLFKNEDKAGSDRRGRSRSPLRLRPGQGQQTAPRRRHPGAQLRTLLNPLATLTKNTVRVPNSSATFDKLSNPTPLQPRELQLLHIKATL